MRRARSCDVRLDGWKLAIIAWMASDFLMKVCSAIFIVSYVFKK